VNAKAALSVPTFLAGLLWAALASADAPPICVTLKDHRFTPALITAPANQPIILNIINADPFAEEFDSPALKVEKVIAGKQSGVVRLHPLRPGRYPFTGEYHPATAQGVVVAQ
jgi:hypothetical protein